MQIRPVGVNEVSFPNIKKGSVNKKGDMVAEEKKTDSILPPKLTFVVTVIPKEGDKSE